MAHAIKVTHGSITYTLTDRTNFIVPHYEGRPADPEMLVVMAGRQDGGMITDIKLPWIADEMPLIIRGSSESDCLARVRNFDAAVGALARMSVNYNPMGVKTYLEVKLNPDSVWSRAPIVGGRFVYDESTLNGSGVNWLLEGTFKFTRFPLWQEEEVQIPLTSKTDASSSTAYRQIENHHDSDGGNYLLIAGTNVKGSYPAPYRLELQNASGSAVFYSKFYLGNHIFGSDPQGRVYILEGEAASGTSSSSDANSSGGAYGSFTVNTTTTLQWSLSGTELAKYDGQAHRFIARFPTITGNVYARLELRESAGLTTIYRGEEVYLNSQMSGHLVDLGALPLPPIPYSRLSANGTLKVVLLFTSTSSVTMGLDFIHFFPTVGYCKVNQLGFQIAAGGVMMFDFIEDALDAGGTMIYSIEHGRPLLWPGINQKIILLQDHATAAPTLSPLDAKLYYRPLKGTL